MTLVAGVVLERSGDAIAGPHRPVRRPVRRHRPGRRDLAARAVHRPDLGPERATTSSPSATSSAATPSCPSSSCSPPCCPGKAVLPQAHDTDIYLTALGMLLTLVYLAGLLFRPQRRIARIGIDSIIVFVLYALGIAGLFAVASSS